MEEPSPYQGGKPGRMKRAQSAFRVKLRRGDTQQVVPTTKPSTLARKGWRGLYARKARKKRTKDETIRDTERSKLLFNELFVATPMVVAFASSLEIDGIGEHRVPVLLEQISVHVTPFVSDGRKVLVKIYFEYGSGPAQLKWHIIRSYRDFLLFHGHLFKSNVWHRKYHPKPPHLPRPKDYGRRIKLEDEAELAECDDQASMESVESTKAATLEAALQRYLERVLVVYNFHGESNRVLHFIELSRLGLALAGSTSFHGKEGPIFVRGRASDQGWRVRHWQPHDISSMIQRHTQKWLLVRESYLVVTESINSTKILDVFLVDPKFKVDSGEEVDMEDPTRAKGLFLTMHNASRALKVATRGELDLGSWIQNIRKMQEKTEWSKHHRFDSFAPVRNNVSCEWFVDGRDYMWVLSDALEHARDTIFIHDWWLSPELYLRRSPEGNQHWRLDRTLQRAAMRGVKIFVVVYRNIDLAIPIDSLWTKHSLLDLHSNIHVLRSPNQPIQKTAVFWAHHEKICIIDSTIAFCGGIDLCFGRWDTPQHTVVDDAYHPFLGKNNEATLPLSERPNTQTWPGKDYSNPRVKDFFELDKPYDDMYDRQVTPRMPWHDIHQSVVGQPARDLARHFVQRWNYIIRQKLPSRPTPLLLPPPAFTDEELQRFKLTGTCEYQVLRSSCSWSIGIKEHEQSIQNAYLKLIDTSEHFIYIENQFFVTSTEVDGVKIENKIGDALVQRIIRAHERGEEWRAIIVIPLMPGFEAPVDSVEASSVRLICQCQFNSISRGTNSIFYRLESAGIIPDQYISFFSLRKWGKIGPQSRLTTEQLYIHAKMLIADDRAAIIGSANINERSMRGVRDSEVAVCVRDTAVVETQMAGKPYKAAKFAYTLRLRVMREHLGIDTDKVDCIEQLTEYLQNSSSETKTPARTPARTPMALSRSNSYTGSPAQQPDRGSGYFGSKTTIDPLAQDISQVQLEEEFAGTDAHSFNWYGGTDANPGVRDHKKFSTDRRIQGSMSHYRDVEGYGIDQWHSRMELEKDDLETAINPAIEVAYRKEAVEVLCTVLEQHNPTSILDFKRIFYNTWCNIPPGEVIGSLPRPIVDEEGNVMLNDAYRFDPWSMDDPVSDEFYHDKWMACAERNTDIYRQVFRCQPDNQVETWREYKKAQVHQAAFYEKQAEEGGPEEKSAQRAPERVNIHVNGGSTGIPDIKVEQVHDGETTDINHVKGVSGTIIHRESDARRNSRSHHKQNGINHKDNPVEDEEVFYSADGLSDDEGYNKADANSEKEDDSKDEPVEVGSYEGKAGSSTTAGLPGIPSLRTIFGTNKPFNPKDTAFPENDEYNGSVNNTEAHSHHEKTSGTIGLNGVDRQQIKSSDGSDKSEGDNTVTFPSFPAAATARSNSSKDGNTTKSNAEGGASTTANGNRRFTATSRRWKHFDQVLSSQSAEEVLSAVTGHLVLFPTEWLRKELESGNWNFQMDRMTPLDIYD